MIACIYIREPRLIFDPGKRERTEEPTTNPLEDCYLPISVFGKSLYNQSTKKSRIKIMSALNLSKIAIIFWAFSSSKHSTLSVMLGLQALNLTCMTIGHQLRIGFLNLDDSLKKEPNKLMLIHAR